MGQAIRTTKLLLDKGKRELGGANTDKRTALDATVQVLDAARAFYIDFFLAHAQKLAERIPYYSSKHLEMRERAISANELLTWAEACTVATPDHLQPWEGWNFSACFPEMPFIYRRSVIKDAIGKVRSYLSNQANWRKSGRKKGQPGWPGASNHPTLYEGAFSPELDALDQRESGCRGSRCTAGRLGSGCITRLSTAAILSGAESSQDGNSRVLSWSYARTPRNCTVPK